MSEHKETTVETQAESVEEIGLQNEIIALKEALEKAEAKAQENWDLALRTKADAENLRRRLEMDLEKTRKFGTEKVIAEVLPVLDSMELGLAAAMGDDADVGRFREGSKLTIKMMQTALERAGVKPLNPEGEKFNPEQHQAMSMQEKADMEPNTVIEVVQKGYLLNDRVLRPAMVIVSKAVSPPPDTPKIDETA